MGFFDIFKKHKKEEAGFDVSPDIGDRSLASFEDNEPNPGFDGNLGQNSHSGFQQQFNQPPSSSTDIQLIQSKLDNINQKLELMDRRLQVIEKIAKESK